jgi:hypothetical protein
MLSSDSPAWNSLAVPFPPAVLTALADEVWRRTRAPLYEAERAKLEVAMEQAATPEDRRQALDRLSALHHDELTDTRHQAILVGHALPSTAAVGYEAWCLEVMSRLRLAPMDRAETEAFLEQAQRTRGTLTDPQELTRGTGQAA